MSLKIFKNYIVYAMAFALIILANCSITNAANPPAEITTQAGREYMECGKQYKDGKLEPAESHGEKALTLLGTYDNQPKVDVYLLLSCVELARGKIKYAEQLAEKGVVLSSKLEGKTSQSYADAIRNQASVYTSQRKWALAEPLLLEATLCYEKLLDKEPAQGKDKLYANIEEKYNDSIKALTVCLTAEGKESEAMKSSANLLKAARKSNITDFNTHMALSNACAETGVVAFNAGVIKDAEPLLKKSIKLYEEWNTRTHGGPRNPSPIIISAMQKLADIYVKSGKVKEAKQLQNEVAAYQKLKESPR